MESGRKPAPAIAQLNRDPVNYVRIEARSCPQMRRAHEGALITIPHEWVDVCRPIAPGVGKVSGPHPDLFEHLLVAQGDLTSSVRDRRATQVDM